MNKHCTRIRNTLMMAAVPACLAFGGIASAQDAAVAEAADEAAAQVEAAAVEISEGQAEMAEALAEVEEAASGAAEAVHETAADAVDAAEEAAGDAMESADEAMEAAGEAMESAEGMMDDAAVTASEAADEAMDAAGDAMDDAEEGAEEDADELLDDAEEAMDDEAADVAAEPVVIVEVNGTAFTTADAETEVEKRMSMFAGQVPPAQLSAIQSRMRDQVVDDFINRTLLQAELDSNDVTAEPAEIDEFIEMAREGLPPGFTLEQFLEQRGLSIEDMRKDVSFQLAAKKLLDKQLGDKLSVGEEEIQEYFEREKSRFSQPEQVHARHVLIKVDDPANEEEKAEKRKQMEEIHAELAGGASFEAVAAEKSDCPSSSRGGDLGTFGRGQMVPAFEEAAFSQDVGTVGDIVETRFGFHVIEVLEHTQPEEPSLDDSRELIVEQLQNQRRGEAFQTYIQDLRNASEISYPGQPSASE